MVCLLKTYIRSNLLAWLTLNYQTMFANSKRLYMALNKSLTPGLIASILFFLNMVSFVVWLTHLYLFGTLILDH